MKKVRKLPIEEAKRLYHDVERYRLLNPGATWAEIHHAIPNHYRSGKAFADCYRGIKQRLGKMNRDSELRSSISEMGVCVKCFKFGINMTVFKNELWCEKCLNPDACDQDIIEWVDANTTNDSALAAIGDGRSEKLNVREFNRAAAKGLRNIKHRCRGI